MNYWNVLATGLVLFGLMSLKQPEEGKQLQGSLSADSYRCYTHLKYPILETEDYFLAVNDVGTNKYGKLRVSVFDHNLNLIQHFFLYDLYILRRKLSNDLLESVFLNAKGQPCVLYSTIDKKTDKANVIKARIDLDSEKLVEPTSVMEFDVPKINIASRINVAHWGEGNRHHIRCWYYKYMLGTVQYDEEYHGYFNALFEPENEHSDDASFTYFGPDYIAGSKLPRFRAAKSALGYISSSRYRFDFGSEEKERQLKVFRLPKKGEENELVTLDLENEYVSPKIHHSEEESIISFFSFKYSMDEKDRYEAIEGFNVCRLDAKDFHLIDEVSHTFSSEEKTEILTDIDKSGRGKLSQKELSEGISPYKFPVRVEFFSSNRFVVLLRDASFVTKTTESSVKTYHKYADFVLLGYSGNGKPDFLDRVHVEESTSGKAVGGILNTYQYNDYLYLLYKNGEEFTYQKLLKSGKLVDLEVDAKFVKDVAELDLDFTNVALQPGTFIVSATDNVNFHLARITLPK